MIAAGAAAPGRCRGLRWDASASPAQRCRGIVYFPNRKFAGMPGGRVFDGLLPVSGDYRIRVPESTMAQPWRGHVTVLVVAY